MVFPETDRDVLGGSFIFKDIPSLELNEILKVCTVKKFDAGEIIINEGDIGRGVYVILEGSVEVYLPKQAPHSDQERPTDVNLAKLAAGLCFGEYSLLDEKEVSASVKALSFVRLCYFSGFDFQGIAGENDRVGKFLYKNLLDQLVPRLRKMDTELDIAFMIE